MTSWGKPIVPDLLLMSAKEIGHRLYGNYPEVYFQTDRNDPRDLAWAEVIRQFALDHPKHSCEPM